MTSRNILSLVRHTVNVVPAFEDCTTERLIQLHQHKSTSPKPTVLYVPGNIWDVSYNRLYGLSPIKIRLGIIGQTSNTARR